MTEQCELIISDMKHGPGQRSYLTIYSSFTPLSHLITS